MASHERIKAPNPHGCLPLDKVVFSRPDSGAPDKAPRVGVCAVTTTPEASSRAQCCLHPVLAGSFRRGSRYSVLTLNSCQVTPGLFSVRMATKAQHDPRYERLPPLLRALREEAGLTQRELGDRLKKPQSWIYNSET